MIIFRKTHLTLDLVGSVDSNMPALKPIYGKLISFRKCLSFIRIVRVILATRSKQEFRGIFLFFFSDDLFLLIDLFSFHLKY